MTIACRAPGHGGAAAEGHPPRTCLSHAPCQPSGAHRRRSPAGRRAAGGAPSAQSPPPVSVTRLRTECRETPVPARLSKDRPDPAGATGAPRPRRGPCMRGNALLSHRHTEEKKKIKSRHRFAFSARTRRMPRPLSIHPPPYLAPRSRGGWPPGRPGRGAPRSAAGIPVPARSGPPSLPAPSPWPGLRGSRAEPRSFSVPPLPPPAPSHRRARRDAEGRGAARSPREALRLRGGRRGEGHRS